MKKTVITSIIGGVLVLGLSVTSFASTDNVGESKKQGNLFEQELVEDGKVKIQVYKEEDSKEIEADMILKQEDVSMKELLKYKKKMPQYYEKLQKDGLEKSPVTVTLNEPISLEKFTELASAHNVNVNRIFARTVDQNGSEGGITVALESGNIVPEDNINSILEGPNKLELIGIYAFEGTISLQDSTFSDLLEDTNVFLADVSYTFIKESVEKSKEYKNIQTKSIKYNIDVNVFDLFWELEHARNME